MCVECMGGNAMDEIVERIAEHGVTFIGDYEREIVYTVGMTDLGLPELYVDRTCDAPVCDDHDNITMGLHAFLELVTEWARQQPSLSIFTRLRPPPEMGPMPFEVAFQATDTTFMTKARQYYHGRDITALRVIRVPVRA